MFQAAKHLSFKEILALTAINIDDVKVKYPFYFCVLWLEMKNLVTG